MLGFTIVKFPRPDSEWTKLPLRDNQVRYAVDHAWVSLRIMWAWLNRHGWRNIKIEHYRPPKRQLQIDDEAELPPPPKRAAT